MRPRRLLLAGVLGLALAGTADAARSDLGQTLAARLLAERGFSPRTHTTDFATDELGCITLTQRELRAFGFRGSHAFVCEDAGSGEVLGAVLNRSGVVRCHISGRYTGDACYDLEMCGRPEPACVR